MNIDENHTNKNMKINENQKGINDMQKKIHENHEKIVEKSMNAANLTPKIPW